MHSLRKLLALLLLLLPGAAAAGAARRPAGHAAHDGARCDSKAKVVAHDTLAVPACAPTSTAVGGGQGCTAASARCQSGLMALEWLVAWCGVEVESRLS